MDRDIIDDLYNIVLKRYSEEYPDIQLEDSQKEAIYFCLKGVLEREGNERALEYARTIKLNDFKKEIVRRGY